MDEKEREIHNLREEVKSLQTKLKKSESQWQTLNESISTVFNPDQVSALCRSNNRGHEWSCDTIQKSFRLRFSCGSKGYEDLIEHGYPLPSLRTLRRRLEGIAFESGCLDDVFLLLTPKVNALSVYERDCCLTLDEMKLTPKLEFDNSADKFIGNITLPGHSGVADYALVFMLSGLSTRWKQTVAYFFTGEGTDGIVFKDLIINLIRKAESTGLKVVAVTSDMGSANRAMWRSFGIIVSRYSQTVCSISHPVDPERQLFFIADPPHVFKNIRNFLLSGQKIKLPKSLVDKFELPSSIVSVEPVKFLYDAEKNCDVKMAPKLNDNVLRPGQFDKMKVGLARRLFDISVEAGIRYMVEQKGWAKENLSTAWFLGVVRKWFDLVTSRNATMALSHFNEEAYQSAIIFLNDVVEIFKMSEMGNSWKPIQTGVILCTSSILKYQDVYLNQDKHLFLLTSRFSQDCLENLFSCVRLKCPIPSALQFKQNLKLITVSQYLKPSGSSSYDADDSIYLAEFLEPRPKQSDTGESTELTFGERDVSSFEIPDGEKAPLYYIAGYCISKFTDVADCTACREFVQNSQENIPYTSFVDHKSYKKDCLVKVTTAVYELVLFAEKCFKQNKEQLLESSGVRERLVNYVYDNCPATENFPSCHDICKRLLYSFFNVRCHCLAKEWSSRHKNKNRYSSKSVAMRALAEKQ